MSLPALPTTLTPPLSGRDAVADALYRSISAFDTADDKLLKSSLATDAMDTTHFVTNLRINITEEDSKAQLTCTVLAQHYDGGEGLKADAAFKLVGGLYYQDLVKDSEDGLWKIKHWKLKSVWRHGDSSFFSN